MLGLLLLNVFVLRPDLRQPLPDLRGSRVLDFHCVDGSAQMERRFQAQALTGIAPVVEPFLSSRLGQGLIHKLCPFGADRLGRVRHLLVPLSSHSVQFSDLPADPPVWLHGIAGDQDIQMVVPGLAVNADVHGHAIGVTQPPPKSLGQHRFLRTREAAWQGRVDLSCHDGILTAAMVFHSIPEGFPTHGRSPTRQDQGEWGDKPLGGVIRHEPSPDVRHPGSRTVSTRRHRRPSL